MSEVRYPCVSSHEFPHVKYAFRLKPQNSTNAERPSVCLSVCHRKYSMFNKPSLGLVPCKSVFSWGVREAQSKIWTPLGGCFIVSELNTPPWSLPTWESTTFNFAMGVDTPLYTRFWTPLFRFLIIKESLQKRKRIL